MTDFVRARSAYTFNNESRGTLRVQGGDVLPADHWAVRSCHDPAWFEPADVDHRTAQAVEDLYATRDELAEIQVRNRGPREGWQSGQLTRFENLQRRESRLLADVRDASGRRDTLRNLARSGQYASEAGATFGAGDGTTTTTQPSTIRDQARRLVDAEHRSGAIPDHAAERVERMLATPVTADAANTARWAVVTGSQAYRGAFTKLLADPDRGHLLWTAEEGAAFRAAEQYRTETRAMGIGTDVGGGYLVPFSLDPAILLTSNGSANPLRRISRVEQIATDAWNGVSSAGATAEWKAEAAEAADGSPVLAQPSIPVHFGDAFVPYSYELGMDGAAFLPELQNVLIDAADQLQATAFMRGTGTGQPKGVITGLPAGSKVATATADALVAADAVKLQNALPPRFQPGAQWCANLATINALGSMETAGGALRFPEVGSGRLLNRPLNEASLLDTAGATAAAGNDSVALYGDFSQFLIVDRIGTTLELVPHLFGANRRPTGQRGALLWFRTGSGVLVDNAFRLLTA